MPTGYEVNMYRHIEQAARSLFSIEKSLERIADALAPSPIETTNPDGSLNANGVAIHMAHDLDGEGFDGTGFNPIDTALTLADFIVRFTGEKK